MFLDIEVDISLNLRYVAHSRIFPCLSMGTKRVELDRKFCYRIKCLTTHFQFTLKQIMKVIMFLGNKSISFCFLWKKISYSIVCLDVCVLISMHKYVNTNCRLKWFQFIGNNCTTYLRECFFICKTGLRNF